MYKSIEKLAHIVFINFKHVKNITEQSKTYQEHIAIFFGIFVRKLKRTGGPSSKNEGKHSKKQEN